jgi:hypothetical protein
MTYNFTYIHNIRAGITAVTEARIHALSPTYIHKTINQYYLRFIKKKKKKTCKKCKLNKNRIIQQIRK